MCPPRAAEHWKSIEWNETDKKNGYASIYRIKIWKYRNFFGKIAIKREAAWCCCFSSPSFDSLCRLAAISSVLINRSRFIFGQYITPPTAIYHTT